MLTVKNPAVRKRLKIVLPFLLIPAAVAVGSLLPFEKTYIYTALVISVLTLFLFIAGFDSKRIGSRRLVVSAVLISLSVISRFIPLFKPVTALTVIGGAYLGSETGFFIGSLTAFLSNFYFGQGPWTPFQMIALGFCGFFAGALSKALKKSRISISIYGFIAGVLYSLLMDVFTVNWYSGVFSLKLYTAALLTSLPFTVLYAVSNGVFVWVLAKLVGEKLNRIRVKYGL